MNVRTLSGIYHSLKYIYHYMDPIRRPGTYAVVNYLESAVWEKIWEKAYIVEGDAACFTTKLHQVSREAFMHAFAQCL